MEKEAVHIVYSFTEAFSHVAAASILSLLEKNADKFDLFIYVLWEGNKEKVESRFYDLAAKYQAKILFVDMSDIAEIILETGAKKYGRDVQNPASNIVYYRFWAAELVPEDVERIIYIGADTLVTGDLKPMINFNLNGKTIAMVADCMRKEYKKVIGIPENSNYYNDDVAIIDVKQWKDRKCTQRVLDYLKKNGCTFPMFCQDLYNVVLGDEITKMPPNFAWLSPYWLYDIKGIYKVYGLNEETFYTPEVFNQSKESIIIHHFCGNSFIRPWFKNSVHPMAMVYKNYYEQTDWNKEGMAEYKQLFIYKVQYVLYRYFPRGINALAGMFMQRIFMRILYHV